MENQIEYKSTLPIAYFIWIVVDLVITVALFINTFFVQAFVLAFLFFVISYVVICRNVCTFMIVENKITVKYWFPLVFKKEVLIRDKTVIEYDLGYYYYLSPEHHVGAIQWMHPCDTIYFYQISNGKKVLYDTLTIYTTYHSFGILRKYLNDFTIQ